MPVHIDAPAAGISFDPAAFRIRGWLWLEGVHPDIAAVEACDGEMLLGTADVATLHERPDVNAKYNLPAGTRTGFDFPAHHPTARPHEPLELLIRARFRDGSRTDTLFAQLLTTPPPERHPFQMLCTSFSPSALGVEIGAHTNPVAGLSPYYTDAVVHFAGTAGRVDFLSDARALPIADGTLDYLCSSHVLEHLPDPIGALLEWHRVLRPGGLLYLVVPDKRFTFDEPRAVTSVEHMLRDFNAGTTSADDAVHVDEFVFQTNWSILSPKTPAPDLPHAQAAARARYLHRLEQDLPIDIHFHTFTPDSLEALLHAAGFLGGNTPRFKLLAHAECYPPGRNDGIGMLLARDDPTARVQRATDTFSLPSSSNGVPALPLACPVSLQPLHLEHARRDQAELVTADAALRYSLSNGRPALRPPRNQVPQRTWGVRSWRIAPNAGNAADDVSRADESIRSHLDDPPPSSRVDPLCFHVRGWLWLDARQRSVVAVEAWAGGTLIGSTKALYQRPDVNTVYSLPADTMTGFELFAHHASAAPGQSFELEIRARLADHTDSAVIFKSTVATIARDYRTNHFGVLLQRETTALQRHANVFAVGPSQSEGSGELAQLLRRYLGPPPQRVIDVGCGFGSYGRGLLADGYDWFGVEVNAADCAELARVGLPHRHVDGRTLPFPSDSFDAALCLEVLEHIEEPRAFLAEVSRVAPRRLIVSVPNCELLGYLWDHLATPWHMLEATHTNFFTRWSLAALLREFYPEVEVRFHTPYPLRTIEGTPLHYNLLAIATQPKP
jgi:SAM-dependent methyltransferase